MLKEIEHDGLLFREMNVMNYAPVFVMYMRLANMAPDDDKYYELFHTLQREVFKASICDKETNQPLGEEGLRQISFQKANDYWPIAQEVNGLIEKKEGVDLTAETT